MICTVTKYRKHIAIFLFILAGLLFANSALNRHLHLYNGHIVSHAHPYHKDDGSQSPFKSHHHSDIEFLIIDQISNLLIIAGITFYLTTTLILIRVVGIIPQKIFIKLPQYSFHNNRAPPFNI